MGFLVGYGSGLSSRWIENSSAMCMMATLILKISLPNAQVKWTLLSLDLLADILPLQENTTPNSVISKEVL